MTPGAKTANRSIGSGEGGGNMLWRCSHRFDRPAVTLADRHYSRQKPGTNQFMKPGSCAVFYARTDAGEAVWGTSWQLAEHVKHEWPGAWECAIFRNEGAGLSSTLIGQAVAATRAHYGAPPERGMITFVDRNKVPGTNPGYCFLQAGFRHVGKTAGGLLVFQMLGHEMPPALAAIGSQFDMLEAA